MAFSSWSLLTTNIMETSRRTLRNHLNIHIFWWCFGCSGSNYLTLHFLCNHNDRKIMFNFGCVNFYFCVNCFRISCRWSVSVHVNAKWWINHQFLFGICSTDSKGLHFEGFRPKPTSWFHRYFVVLILTNLNLPAIPQQSHDHLNVPNNAGSRVVWIICIFND